MAGPNAQPRLRAACSGRTGRRADKAIATIASRTCVTVLPPARAGGGVEGWPWLPDKAWETTVSIALEPAGYGTLMTLTDGPFDLRVPGVLDAYAEANEPRPVGREGWGKCSPWLRGYVDFSVELRARRY